MAPRPASPDPSLAFNLLAGGEIVRQKVGHADASRSKDDNPQSVPLWSGGRMAETPKRNPAGAQNLSEVPKPEIGSRWENCRNSWQT